VSGPPRGLNGMGALPGWAALEAAVPQVAATMRRYLTQISCILRPGSVSGADQALRCFAAFLAQAAPEVTSIAQVTRRHIEDYKPPGGHRGSKFYGTSRAKIRSITSAPVVMTGRSS